MTNQIEPMIDNALPRRRLFDPESEGATTSPPSVMVSFNHHGRVITTTTDPDGKVKLCIKESTNEYGETRYSVDPEFTHLNWNEFLDQAARTL